MPFPQSPRVIYRKNPLERVICQLRFPTILEIETVPPTDFQKEIRREYPVYSESREGALLIPPEVMEQIPDHVLNSIFKSFKKHEFISSDEQWIITLTKDFLALTSLRYTTWDTFKSHLEQPLNSLLRHYEPAFFSRIGLRYQNVIRRSALGLGSAPWSELLREYIAAEFASDIADSVNEAGHTLVVQLDGVAGQVRIQHGLIQNMEDDNGSRCYLIDDDFFCEERIDVYHARAVLDSFNAKSGHLFRWCITSKLHEAMEPQTVPQVTS